MPCYLNTGPVLTLLELVRHKGDLKVKKHKNGRRFLTPVSILLVVLCLAIIFSVCRRIYYGHLRDKTLRASPVKVYNAPPEARPSLIKDRTDENVESNETSLSSKTLSGNESLSSETLSDNDVLSSPESSLSSREDEVMDTTGKPKKNPEAEKAEREAALEKRRAETDALLEEASTIVEEGIISLNQVAPQLANYLNSLSKEEQANFLEQSKKTYMSYLPSDANQDTIDEMWQTFLELLDEHGYQPK